MPEQPTRGIPVWTIAMGLAVLLLGACSARQLGLPRTPVEARSPDGRYVASVRNHLSIDPPKQSLWLRDITATAAGQVRLARLGEDTHWCSAIVWSSDSTRVAFLIQDASVEVFDSATHRPVASRRLIAEDADPTSRAVRELAFSQDAGALEITVCDRRRGDGCETASVPLSS